MDATIRCPHCRRKLKVKDERLLGQTVRCPGCAKPVELQLPSSEKSSQEEDEVRMELVTDEPAEGTSARWVPDQPPASPASAFPFTPAPKVDPSPERWSEAREPDATNARGDSSQPGPLPFVVDSEPPLRANAASTSAAERYLHRRRRKNRVLKWVVVGAVVAISIGVVAFLVTQYQPAPATAGASPAPDTPSPVDPSLPYSRAKLEGNVELIAEFKPTSGEPIELFMMPSGVSTVIHLRPALLWSNDYEYQVLRASLTSDVTDWIEAKLVDICRRKPDQIEELLIGLIFGARGTPPDVCVVVHLKEAEPLVNLIDEFDGTYLNEVPIPRIKVNDTHAYVIQDEKTFAICPAQYAGELENWLKTPNYEVPVGIAEMLPLTDRDRIFTIVGQLGDLRRHANMLFPDSARDPLLKVADWLGDDVETICWSVHTDPYFHSELHLRPGGTTSTQALADDIKAKLNQLPTTMWKEVCVKMHPQEMRFRKMVGRYPAMLEAFRESTVIYTSHRQITMTTVLPSKAAPNLALGTMFTVNEASRTDFGTPAPVMPQSTEPKLPETVAERLKLPVDVEFNRTPLEQAFDYLCGKIEVNLSVDGDALKDAGYTKNMPQTFTLGEVPVERALFEILKKYQEANGQMVIWIDESTKTLYVTTRKFAERDGRTVYEIKGE